MSSSGIGSGRKLGRYHLVEPIGGGPTGEVFRAKVYGVAGFERQFAVKRFHPELVKAKTVADAIARAARSYGNLEHPRIARMQEFGIAGGETFAAVEMVEGIDAAQLVQRTHGAGEPMQPGAGLTLIKQAARAVGYAHGRGVSHLGLCPTNIVCGTDGDAKVTDFGFLPPRLPDKPGDDATLMPRAPYLAPEQFVGEPTGPATDVFQLGVVLFELLTGNKPFSGRSSLDVQHAVLSSAFAEPPLPPPVLEVLHRALARVPGERYPDGSAMADAIEAAMRSAPMPGGPRDVAAVVRAAVEQRNKVGSEQVSGAFNFPMPSPPRSITPPPRPSSPSGSQSPLARAIEQGRTPPPERIKPPPTPTPPPTPVHRRTALGVAPKVPSDFAPPGGQGDSEVDENAPTKIRDSSSNLATAATAVHDVTPLPPPIPGSLEIENELADMLGPQDKKSEPPAEPPPPPPSPPRRPGPPGPVDLEPATGTVDEHIELDALLPPEGAEPEALPKRKRSVAGPLIAVLVLAALGAGGYFGYQEYFAGAASDEPPADGSTVVVPTDAPPDAAPIADAIPPDAAPADAPSDFEVRSQPEGATIYLDGTKVGRTPMTVEATGDSFKLALILPGHKLYTADIEGRGAVDVTLEEVTPFNGRAGIKVRCRKKNRYYVFVDGEDTGMLCPTERIGVTLGKHVVEIYDPVTDSRNAFNAVVEETRRSLRVRVD